MFGFKRKKTAVFNDEDFCANYKDEYVLPLIPIKGAVFGPEISTSFDFGKPNSVKALEYSANTSNVVVIAMQKTNTDNPSFEDFGKICSLADIKDITKLSQGVFRVNATGLSRVRILEIIKEEPFLMVRAKSLPPLDKYNEKIVTLSKLAKEKYLNLLNLSGHYEEACEDQFEGANPEKICDIITAYLIINPSEYFEILQETNLTVRLEKTVEYLIRSVNNAKLELELENKLMLQFTSDQRSRYLREKRNLISRELSDEDDDDEIYEYREKLESLPIPEEYKTRVLKEMTRLEMTPPGSQEAAVIQSYLECILDLPWNMQTDNDFSVSEAVEILESEHYGLEKVKERIVEYIAVMKRTNSLKSPILCLVGPPGVGKTSIARSVANATGRKFVRVSLGGMHDEAEIRGHRKTYVGAMPGRIISGLRQAQSKNPVFLLDEIDKLSHEMKGDPASALLEALDPEQNSTFTDTYVEIPFDLSDVMFVTTANTTSTIPAPLLDRMELIELNGYMPDEKVEIAKRHLIPKQLEANGISADNIEFTDEIIYEIVDKYTRETGVRQLERAVASLCRKAAKKIVVDNELKLDLKIDNLSDYLGKEVHTYEVIKDESKVGVVNGLAWTSVGGDTLTIEAVYSPGSGKLELTGNLGDVMKESAKAAVGYIRANAEKFGLAHIDWSKIDLNVHVPEGAVPKDGPSAGITIATAIISALSDKGVAQQIAMTGEVTLTGRVLPIGGLREKLLAANRARAKSVIIPSENKADLKDIPLEILDSLEILYAETLPDVYGYVFGERNEN